MKLALCLIVKPSNDEAVVLNQALKNAAKHVDGVFVTITGKNKNVEEVAKKYGAHISFYEWDYNFANARNYNFSQVPKEYDYILWMDADDMFRGLEKLRGYIEENPDVDGFTMNYLYSFDEYKNPDVVHLKTMVVRNDNCVTWVGALHEDFAENRQINVKLLEDVERLHISNETRYNNSKIRNVEVARKDMERKPDDPRSYWNLGNALSGAGEYEEAKSVFLKFLSLSQSDDEKYIARLRLVDILNNEGAKGEAVDMANYAIGLKPEYPDAYHAKGTILASMGSLEQARDSILLGLVKKPPYTDIIVFNPRDYDLHPLYTLAKIYLQLGQPSFAQPLLEGCLKIAPKHEEIKRLLENIKEAAAAEEKAYEIAGKLKNIKSNKRLEEELAKVDPEIRQHPILCTIRNTRIIKKQSSGKDLVIYCGYTEEEWNPASVEKKGIGGSEEAVINLARGLVKRGWNVEVYNNCGYKEQEYDGVVYKPYWAWNYRDKQDVVILWRAVMPAKVGINASKVFVDLHDALPEGELLKWMHKVDRFFVKSNAHRALYPNIADGKFVIIPNGVDVSLFEEQYRDPYYLANFSSPDRGLETILDILPEVLKRVPKEIAEKVKFGWYYGWGVYDSSHTSVREQEWKVNVLKKFEDLKKVCSVSGGHRINHKGVAVENAKAGALLYPTEFYEIDYIGGSKAQVAGCYPITTDFAALDEKIQYGTKVHSKKTKDNWAEAFDKHCHYGVTDEETKEQFIQAVVEYLNNAEKYEEERKKMSEWARKKYDWDVIIDQWDGILKS